ncbi:heme exporter protein CcmD [Pasteurella canis]|uniref:Heme exporter protein D n=1 Tax=Pasteurella canis TaxID=753 RepID=A0A379EVB6_9PAST|nr:heme exporter protein CcmD [Pasteurella canis]MXN88412.1 heme exporter protein CcmD [Pasteurella canis]UAX41451.1 heme exporter protein CcmD [Pasteurella canis]UAY76957.1 heme exporter protein CcmD [Pasteurella canis]UDW82991.1 heme exporter protein CcmD [Pasteurella canis]UEA16094.1 heme exporter protein CcmD [Pasteurella canis]
MFFETWHDFFNMGGYGFYVWLAYGISFVSVVLLIVQSIKERKSILKDVIREQQRQARLQKDDSRGVL